MGFGGKLLEKEKAQTLRRAGFSVKEIESRLKVSRSSVSLWTRDIKLTKKQLAKLYKSKLTGALKGSHVASQNKIKAREKNERELLLSGEKEVGSLSQRDRFIAGVALYYGEGNKAGKNVAFTNADSDSHKFMIQWFRKYCKVPDDKFRCYLYIHDNLNEKLAKKYWSRLLNLPLSQFNKSYIVKNNPNRFRKSKHLYGVLRVSISDIYLLRRIKGWISGVFRV